MREAEKARIEAEEEAAKKARNEADLAVLA